MNYGVRTGADSMLLLFGTIQWLLTVQFMEGLKPGYVSSIHYVSTLGTGEVSWVYDLSTVTLGACVVAASILIMKRTTSLPVRKVLVDEAATIETEIYFSITNDRAEKKPVMIASAAGGVDIEEVAATTPEKIIKVHVDPLLGLRDYQARDLAAFIDLPREYWREFGKIASGLWQTYKETDATLAEINPLVITKDKRLIALDGKMIIDDNALFRHAELAEMRDTDEEAPAETEARKYDLSYIKLDGDIGCMVNGAGLAMTSMDIVKLFGGEPANFLDIGGGAGAEKVAAAMRIILSDPNVKESK